MLTTSPVRKLRDVLGASSLPVSGLSLDAALARETRVFEAFLDELCSIFRSASLGPARSLSPERSLGSIHAGRQGAPVREGPCFRHVDACGHGIRRSRRGPLSIAASPRNAWEKRMAPTASPLGEGDRMTV